MDVHRPLARFWPRDYEAAIVVAALEDAGFHPMIECDPRGWMHFYGWPFGAIAPTLVWIPASEADDALGFLRAPCEQSCEAGPPLTGFAAGISRARRAIYGLWLGSLVLAYLLDAGFWLVFVM